MDAREGDTSGANRKKPKISESRVAKVVDYVKDRRLFHDNAHSHCHSCRERLWTWDVDSWVEMELGAFQVGIRKEPCFCYLPGPSSPVGSDWLIKLSLLILLRLLGNETEPFGQGV